MTVERIGALFFPVGSPAHEDATAHAQESSNELARLRGELEAARGRVAALEAERVLLRRACDVAEARREVAEVERDRHAEEVDRMRIVFLQHELDAKRAN